MAQTLGPYTLGEPLGTLPFGDLIEASHAARREPLALLILPDELARDHRLRGLLRLEIARAGGLRHPAIARPVEVGEHDGRLYVVYERPTGEPLGRWIDGAPDLTAEAAVTMVRQLADGLDTAHGRRLAHGAIGPSAILTRTGESAALVGIGVLAALDEAGLSDACRPTLDPALAAPEQQSGRLAVPSADSHALGRLARMLLAATADGQGGQIPHGAQAAFDRQASAQPTDRFRTCAELAAALADALAPPSHVPSETALQGQDADRPPVAAQPAPPSAPRQRVEALPAADVAPTRAQPGQATAPRPPTKKRPTTERPWRQDGNHRVTSVEATPAMWAAVDAAFSAAVLRLVAVGAGPLFLLVIALLMRELLPLVAAIAGIVVLRVPSATTRAIRLACPI